MEKKTIGLILIGVAVTVVGFILKPVVFPNAIAELGPTLGIAPPPASYIPLLIFLEFWDSLSLGVGVALLIWGLTSYSKWPNTMKTTLILVSFGALQFTLPNWFHVGAHQAWFDLKDFFTPLLIIDYTFHTPWLIFAGLLCIAIRRIGAAPPPQRSPGGQP